MNKSKQTSVISLGLLLILSVSLAFSLSGCKQEETKSNDPNYYSGPMSAKKSTNKAGDDGK